MKLRDMTGEIVGRLTVLRRGENGPKGQTQWVCVCDCKPDREVLVQASGMSAGRTHSCGCLREEVAGDATRVHGKSHSRVHNSWTAAKQRCTNRMSRGWKKYGARGITMCPRWRESFEAFYADMGDPLDGTSIDRIDNDKGYWCGKPECPECGPTGRTPNCRWATPREQANNTRRNLYLTVGEETATITEWSRRIGVAYEGMRARYHKNEAAVQVVGPASHEIERLITGPDGTTLRLSEWARRTGISAATILWRIKDGWSEALAASTPKTHRYRPATQKQ